MVNYAPDFLRFKQPYDPFSPTPDALPIRSPLLSEARANAVPVVKNWSHPFKDNRNPLQQLTHMAKAVAGFYPLGASGLWHGGIHFDGGTAGTLDQSSVHCLADGEVVAYRIDRYSPTTKYWVNNITVNKPFSRNFVLVRHRLQLPKVESSEVEPPSLIFYSLYMHLQDWAVYEGDEAIARPPFWSEGATRYVKPDVNDMHIRYPDQQGLNVRAHGPTGPILDLALRGSQVTVSGEGNFRKLENTSGPDYLKDAEGALRGYISADYLRPIADGQYRIHCATKLNIRAEPRSRDRFGKEVEVLGALPNGTEITVSGEGAFRKLEHINQYVHYPSLQRKQEPLAQNQVVVLDQPVPIKAGDLIGHIGLYQDQGAQQPERKLHLEVFSGDDVEVFIKNSRVWAQRLPATSKTWLKLAKGTPVAAHQDHFSPQYPPTLSAASTPSDADLQVPKSLLDGLPAERKITVPAAWDRKTCNWYRLDGLLHDANNTLLDGWICEEVGVTPWVSPWEWDGYDALFNFDSPRLMLAAYLRTANRFDDVQLERFGPIADAGDKGPIKERLYDIIGSNRDDQITAEVLRAALCLPAHAQSISQLIFHSESEWYHTPKKWDALDELLGHSGSTPNLNWLAEKERIKQLSWWSEVAEKVGLSEQGKAYHFHPVGLLGSFISHPTCKSLSDSIELALRVSGGYEGQSALDYHALADDFDGQGTSFGLIQWNFGQGTLGPVLLKMLNKNNIRFAECFPGNTNYEKLKNSLLQGNKIIQLEWAREVIRGNRNGWKQAFTALGDVLEFQIIQLDEAARFHSNVQKCLQEMRRMSPELMQRVCVLTYVALYDLCVQQGGLDKAETLSNITKRIIAERPDNQSKLLQICVQERAKTASSRWVADCMSRRMGIIQATPYSATLSGQTAIRSNSNFHLLAGAMDNHVCDL